MTNKLETKIISLLEQRGIWNYAKLRLDPLALSTWREWSMENGRRIYALDYYYESHHKVGGATEVALWEKLRQAPCASYIYARDALELAVSQLRQYGHDEGRIHAYDKLSATEWPEISLRKSADVSLARELVYVLMASRSPSVRVREFLRFFDQIMEIIEDLEDLPEDCDDWNLNFWLTPIRQGQRAAASVTMTLLSLKKLCRNAESAWDKLSYEEQSQHRPDWATMNAAATGVLSSAPQIIGGISGLAFVRYSELPKHPLLSLPSAHPMATAVA